VRVGHTSFTVAFNSKPPARARVGHTFHQNFDEMIDLPLSRPRGLHSSRILANLPEYLALACAWVHPITLHENFHGVPLARVRLGHTA
jgi:hypothetical protein